jgi:uracil-DNA glycosylase
VTAARACALTVRPSAGRSGALLPTGPTGRAPSPASATRKRACGSSGWCLAAHGANRTGRVFTGDNSGNFLYAALHRAALANQPTATSRDDGLHLTDCYISATARCAPPANKPTPDEIARCADFLDAEWILLRRNRVILALGKIAWDAALALAARQGCTIPRPRPPFGHAAELELTSGLHLLGFYHVSQQNTFTGKLTPAMFDAILRRAKQLSLE